MKKCFFALVILCVILCGCNIKERKNEGDVLGIYTEDIKKGETGDDRPITRAEVCRMIALEKFDKDEILTAERVLDFSDTDKDKWYDKYINVLFKEKMISGTTENEFSPEEHLTLQQAQFLIDRLDKESKTKIKIDDNNKDKPVSYALWCEIFKKFSERSKEAELVIMGVSDGEKIPVGYIMTDKGIFGADGIDARKYMNTEVKALCIENEMIAITEVTEVEPMIKNVYVSVAGDNEVYVTVKGIEKKYHAENGIDEKGIRDIKIKGDNITEIKNDTTKIEDTLICVEEKAELKNYGKTEIDDNFRVYSDIDGDIKGKELKDIMIGEDNVEFYVKNGVLSAAIVHEEKIPDKIRVMLSKTGYGGAYHTAVDICATGDYVVESRGEIKKYKKDDVFHADKNNDERVYIYPENENDRIIIKSIGRGTNNEVSPKYRGRIEVISTENGFVAVNEVGMEEYLYSVVSSEMPADFGEESAKVQALAARSYAYRQLRKNEYMMYGANVDDSVNCQVYNNMEESETAVKAVNDTRGEYIVYNGEVANGNFFSTSGGYTADSGEIWADGAVYPTESKEYLKGEKQFDGEDIENDNEGKLLEFYKNVGVDSYDSGSPFFRWQFEMNDEQLQKNINKNLKNLTPNGFIYLMNERGEKENNKKIEDIGKIKNIEVLERGNGGNIMQMKITGDKMTIIIKTEQNIRRIITPEETVLVKKDGSKDEKMNMIPSSFYAFEKEEKDGAIKKIKIYGGGYGHGVGMSQYGVKGMTERGFGIEEIIKHYYNGSSIEKIGG
ncbi:MAG: SpoIID/LytB domain-containing protein [Firmicutes bacterium]|nr:SpoIID/LytB domain-containing protein [Bacillota bacterium]